MNTTTMLAMLLLALVAVLHVLRIAFGIEMTVNGSVVPMWASVVAALVAGGIATRLWHEGRVHPSGHRGH